jgi:glycine/D-amino acid oxidase-like deaminating enzyme
VRERVAIVGGGVIGSAVALELARRGLDVVLLEADGIAAGVTGGSLAALTSHLAGDPDDLPFVRESTDRWAILAAELERELGIDVEHRVTGQLSLVEADTPEEAEEVLAGVRDIVAREHAQSLGVELVDARRAREIVPALAGSRVVAATWCPGDAKINALLACRALVHAAARRGADVRPGYRVQRIRPGDAGWILETVRGAVRADAVVVACGPWSGELLAELEPRVARVLQPKRAQCCVTDGVAPLIEPVVASISVGISTGYTQLHQTSHGQVMFNTVAPTEDPRLGDGRLDDRVDHDFMVVSARKLADLFPALRRARLLRAWAACEAWTPDRRFLIGPVGPREGLFVAAGDSGVGFLQAPMVARAVSALVRRDDFGHDLRRYAPLRPMEEVAA